jgi:excisionase family DNA binding protein
MFVTAYFIAPFCFVRQCRLRNFQAGDGQMTGHTPNPERAAYSVAEAAVLAGVGRDQVYSAIREGQLEARKWGRRTVIPAEALRRFLSDFPPLRLPAA